MKRPALTPLTLALACSLSTPTLAQSHDHAHHHHAPAKTSAGGGSESIVRDPVAHESTDGHEHHEHHGQHERHEHHGHQNPHAHHRPPDPILAPVTDADRAAAFPDLGAMTMADHGMDDDAIHFKTLVDGLEWRRARDGGSDAFGWNATTWIGRDIDKLWLKTSGERRAGRTGSAHVEALWGHAIGPWWDTVAGVRHDSRPGPSRTRAAVGIQGLAPYQFEIDAMLYLGGPGRAELKLHAEYELLITWRWILTPSLATGVRASSDPRHGLDSGWSGVESGLKLRYEIRPELAPYIGYIRHDGGNVADTEKGGQWVAGIRFWF